MSPPPPPPPPGCVFFNDSIAGSYCKLCLLRHTRWCPLRRLLFFVCLFVLCFATHVLAVPDIRIEQRHPGWVCFGGFFLFVCLFFLEVWHREVLGARTDLDYLLSPFFYLFDLVMIFFLGEEGGWGRAGGGGAGSVYICFWDRIMDSMDMFHWPTRLILFILPRNCSHFYI